MWQRAAGLRRTPAPHLRPSRAQRARIHAQAPLHVCAARRVARCAASLAPALCGRGCNGRRRAPRRDAHSRAAARSHHAASALSLRRGVCTPPPAAAPRTETLTCRADALPPPARAALRSPRHPQLRLVTAIKTPYLPDGRIDLFCYDSLVEQQIAAGVEGLIVGGTTGEGHLMSWDEHIMLIAHTANRCAPAAALQKGRRHAAPALTHSRRVARAALARASP